MISYFIGYFSEPDITRCPYEDDPVKKFLWAKGRDDKKAKNKPLLVSEVLGLERSFPKT